MFSSVFITQNLLIDASTITCLRCFTSPKTPASSHLSILLTPFSKGEATEQSKLASEALMSVTIRSDASLPTSTLKPSRKSKAGFGAQISEHPSVVEETQPLQSSRGAAESLRRLQKHPSDASQGRDISAGNKHLKQGASRASTSISAVTWEFDFQFKADPDV